MITGKPEAIIDRKQALFKSLIPLVNGKIGREIDQYEKEAIAFAVEGSFQERITAEAFLSNMFGAGENVTGRDAAIKIHNSVHEAKIRKINNLIAENPSDSDRLKRNQENFEIGHNRTLENYQKGGAVYIGAVQEDWIPAWFRPSNHSLRQER